MPPVPGLEVPVGHAQRSRMCTPGTRVGGVPEPAPTGLQEPIVTYSEKSVSQMLNPWQSEIGLCGNIYTIGIGKCYKLGLLLTTPPPPRADLSAHDRRELTSIWWGNPWPVGFG